MMAGFPHREGKEGIMGSRRFVLCALGVIILSACLGLASQGDSDSILGFHTSQAVGEKRLIVIFVDFPDLTRQYPIEVISDRLLKLVNAYFYAASYNTMWFKGEVVGPYVLPHPVEYYRISAHNLFVDPTRVAALVRDSLALADPHVLFTPDAYVVLALGASNRDYGMVGLCAIPGMLGWSTTTAVRNPRGEEVRSVAIFCENAHVGTYVHDIVHMLGGVADGKRLTPCLYDHDCQAAYERAEDWPKCLFNMGYWDPLSSHFPYNRELPPAGLSSWTKMRLGWIPEAKIACIRPGETATVRLDPLADPAATTLVIKIPLTEDTYYLIENRQPVNSDANLPSSGVLVLYADDRVPECREGAAPVRIVDAAPQVPYFLDAAFDVGKARVFVDTTAGIAVTLLAKVDRSYDVLVTTPVLAPETRTRSGED